MKLLHPALIFTLLLPLMACSPAPEAPAAADKARQLLVLAGVSSGINKVASDKADVGKKPPATQEEQVQYQVDSLVKSVFTPAQMEEAMTGYLLSHLTENDMDNALAWLGSALGKKISQLDQQVAPADESMIDPAQNVARVKLLEQLYFNIYIASGSIDALTGFQKTVFEQVTQNDSRDRGLPAADTRQFLDELGSRYQQEHMVSTITDMLYNYRSLSDAELNDYLAFASSASGRNYHRALFESMASAASEALAKRHQNSTK